MPLYKYDCLECGNRSEALVRDATPPTCPSCGSQVLERAFSSFAVSSQGTKRSALESGRRHQAKEERDKKVAEHEYFHKHKH